MRIFIILFLSILSSIFYRLGGLGGAWWKNTRMRDIGCSLCLIAYLWLFKGFSWLYLPVFGLSWLGLSAYWKGKSVDMKWYHWAFHGLGCGLAALPLIFMTNILSIIYRTLFCVIAMTAVSEFSDKVEYEEIMRGFIFCASVVFFI